MRRVSGWNGACLDVVDSGGTTTTVGFAGNYCNLAAVAALPQPVTISKVYDQSGNGNDATTTGDATTQPSFDAVGKSISIDNYINSGSAVAGRTKQLMIPNGVAINKNSCSIFQAVKPKGSLYTNAFFTMPYAALSTVDLDLWLTQSGGTGSNTGTNNLYTNNGGGGSFNDPNVPSITGSVLGLVSGATACNYFLDGNSYAHTALASKAIAGGVIGSLANGAPTGAINLYAHVVYARVLTSTEQAQLYAALASAFSFPSSFSSQIICDGDSITFGTGATLNIDWVNAVSAAIPSAKVYNFGVPQQGISAMVTAATNRIVSRFNSSVAKNCLMCWAGTNDLNSNQSAATVYANLQSYTATVKAAGFKVSWATCLYRTDFTTTAQTNWPLYNAMIRSATLGQSNTADVIADVQADPTIGPMAAASNPALFNVYPGVTTSGIHPTDLGNTYVAPIMINAANALLAM